MEKHATPSSGSKGNNGRTFLTPKNRKKSPGDALGSGKSQILITRFYSPSSDKSSQPYSPIASSPRVKRRTSEDSPQPKKRRRTKAASSPQNQQILVLSSDDSSDEIFTQDLKTNSKPLSPAVVPKSRLNLIKRRLYPVTSSPISSDHSSSRPKKKHLSKSVPKLRRSRILSDSDPEHEFPMENFQEDRKPLQDLVPQSSQMTQVRRPLCPETSSQAIVITSSDDSDFELHNSRQSQSFLSQSFCNKSAPQSSQKSFLSSQTNRVGCKKTVGSSFVGKPATGTQKFLGKRCSLEDSSDSASTGSKDSCDVKTPTSSRRDVNVSSVRLQKVSHESPPLSPDSNKGDDFLYDDTVIEPERVHDDPKDDGKTQVPLTPVQNRDVPSIYLQDTIPLSSSHDISIQPDNDETDDPEIFQTQMNSATKHSPSRRTDHQGSAESSSHQTTVPRSPPPLDHSIYNEETIDLGMNLDSDGMNLEATSDSGAMVDFSDKPSTNSEPNSNASAYGLKTTLPVFSPKGAVIEPSDDEDDSIMTQNQSDHAQVSKNKRASLGVIPLSELLDVSHISGSDNSNFSDIVHSDDDVSSMEGSGVLFPGSPDALASQITSLLVEGSDESNTGITSIMNSMLDASADFFSDIVSSLTIGESTEEQDQLEDGKRSEKQDTRQGPSPTEEIVNIALAVAGLEKASESQNSVDMESRCVGVSGEDLDLQQSLAPDSNITVTSELGMDCNSEVVGLPKSDSRQGGKYPPSFGVNGSRPVMVDDTPNTVTAGESDCNERSMPEEASLVHENEENATPVPPQSCSTLAGACAIPMNDSCMDVAAPDNGSPSMPIAGDCMDMTSSTNGVPAEIKIVCGSQPSESSAKLHITQNLDKTLLQNLNRPLLLDTIISECQNYAEHVLSQEPIKMFVFKYSNLPQTSKLALHGCLLELLEDSNRWLKYQEPSAGSIDNLVSNGLFEYLNENGGLLTKLNHLTVSEITDVLCKLGNSPSQSIETMKTIILNKFTSAYTCERVKKDVIDLINRKFVKLTDGALFCIKICLELFAYPLNLYDKLYKTVDIARFANTLIRDLSLNRVLLLPLKTSKMVVDSGRVLCDLSDLCRLKSEVFGSGLNDESIYLRVNDICSSIAVLDVSAEPDPSVKNSPTFRFLMTNYVHALDEQLKTLLYFNASDIEFGACIYLGFLLKQNVTGFQHKVKWCRERMRHLSKLFDTTSNFEEFSKILKEPVPPVEFIVRSEFVSGCLKMKKLGLSQDEKMRLMKLLRPISHKRTLVPCVPLNSYLNYYGVLTKKPKGKNFSLVRANIFENYKLDFPCGVEDNGGLLLNAIFLTFWQAIYHNADGMFVNKFQISPLDWGSEEFFSKRGKFIDKLASEMKKHGLPAVFKLIKCIFEQFFSHRCVVDWQLVAPNMSKMLSIVETLGLERFLKISTYVLGKLDERVLGFPDIVLWNPESKSLKFLGLRKPTDPLYPYQILWLEKLLDFDVDAEELLQMSGYTGPEQCSQLK